MADMDISTPSPVSTPSLGDSFSAPSTPDISTPSAPSAPSAPSGPTTPDVPLANAASQTTAPANAASADTATNAAQVKPDANPADAGKPTLRTTTKETGHGTAKTTLMTAGFGLAAIGLFCNPELMFMLMAAGGVCMGAGMLTPDSKKTTTAEVIPASDKPAVSAPKAPSVPAVSSSATSTMEAAA